MDIAGTVEVSKVAGRGDSKQDNVDYRDLCPPLERNAGARRAVTFCPPPTLTRPGLVSLESPRTTIVLLILIRYFMMPDKRYLIQILCTSIQ